MHYGRGQLESQLTNSQLDGFLQVRYSHIIARGVALVKERILAVIICSSHSLHNSNSGLEMLNESTHRSSHTGKASLDRKSFRYSVHCFVGTRLRFGHCYSALGF